MKDNIFLIELFNALNVSGISYSVLRNYLSLPNNCGGSDLDIWVAEKDVDKCLLILKEVSEKSKSSLVSYTPGKYCSKFCFLNTESGVQIDLFKGVIICKGKVLLEGSDIVDSTKDYNGIRVLDERLGDLIAFLKEILNNGKCEDKYIIPLYDHKECFVPDYFKNHLSAFSNSYKELLYKVIGSNSVEKQVKTLSELGKKELGITNIGCFIQKIKNLRRVIRPTGYTIAVLGTDGSGKSYIINSITPILEEAFHKGIRYEHMRPNYLPSIAVLTGRKDKNEHIEVCSNPHASKPSGFLGSILRLSYYWIDYTWGYFRKVYLDKTFKSHVWIFDRYYYDYYVDQTRSCVKLPKWIIKTYGIFVPSTDIVICLGGDPKKIYERKPETSLIEVERQTSILKEFATKEKNAVWVDTTMQPADSIKASMSVIVSVMEARYKKTNIR